MLEGGTDPERLFTNAVLLDMAASFLSKPRLFLTRKRWMRRFGKALVELLRSGTLEIDGAKLAPRIALVIASGVYVGSATTAAPQ